MRTFGEVRDENIWISSIFDQMLLYFPPPLNSLRIQTLGIKFCFFRQKIIFCLRGSYFLSVSYLTLYINWAKIFIHHLKEENKTLFSSEGLCCSANIDIVSKIDLKKIVSKFFWTVSTVWMPFLQLGCIFSKCRPVFSSFCAPPPSIWVDDQYLINTYALICVFKKYSTYYSH